VPRALPPRLNQLINLPAMPPNHGVQLIISAACEQKRLDLQDAAGACVEGFAREHQVAPVEVKFIL